MSLLSLLKIGGTTGKENTGRPPEGSREEKERSQRTVEIAVLLILATGTVASAWCVYQAAAWGNVQMENIGALSLMQAQSIRLTDNDNTLRSIDISTFLQWADAAGENQTKRMMFLENRFRDEFRPAFQEWLKSGRPGELPPGTPLTLPSYSLATTRHLEDLRVNMTNKLDAARQANQNGDAYVLTTVFSALILFFAGIAGKWKWPMATFIFIAIALVFLAIVLQRVFTLPVLLG